MGELVLMQRAPVPSVSQVLAFLRAEGWAGKSKRERWAVYARDDTEVEVPLVETAPDFPRAMGMLLDDLAGILERPAVALLRDIRVQDKDLLRLRIEGRSAERGQLSLEVGRAVYQGVRDLLVAVACSVLEPKAVYAARKPKQVMDLVNNVYLGLPEQGSVVLVIENPLPPALHQQRLGGAAVSADDVPMERRVSLRFAESMVALAGAVQDAQVSSSLDPFTQAVPRGVSANLCDAVGRILEATEAERVSTSAALSSTWPLPPGVQPAEAVLGGSMRPVLCQAAKGMREQAVYPGVTIEGPVVKLDSDDPQHGGTVAIRAQALEFTRTLWVTLEAGDYALVVQAHKDGQLVRLTGELKREGRWLLRIPRDLQIVPLDDAIA